MLVIKNEGFDLPIDQFFVSNENTKRIKKGKMIKQLEMISSPLKDQHRGR